MFLHTVINKPDNHLSYKVANRGNMEKNAKI